jgi:hypothetical protein
MKAAATHALDDLGSFVLRDGPLDLKEELIVGRTPDRVLAEVNLHGGPFELLEKQDLVRIPTGQTIRTENDDDVEPTFARVISKLVEARAVEAGAAVPFIRVGGGRGVAELVLVGVAPDRCELTLDRLLSLLHLGRDACVECRESHLVLHRKGR